MAKKKVLFILLVLLAVALIVFLNVSTNNLLKQTEAVQVKGVIKQKTLGNNEKVQKADRLSLEEKQQEGFQQEEDMVLDENAILEF